MSRGYREYVPGEGGGRPNPGGGGGGGGGGVEFNKIDACPEGIYTTIPGGGGGVEI